MKASVLNHWNRGMAALACMAGAAISFSTAWADDEVVEAPPIVEGVPVVTAEESIDRRPEYEYHRPAWGVSVTSSLDAFGNQTLTAAQGNEAIRSFMIQAEYQFPFLQSIGVLSFGPSVAIYPIFPLGSVSPAAFSNWSAGGQVRYQARYFREQPLVPVAGFQYESMAYHFSNGPSGRVTISSPFAGLMLLLNWLEPTSTFEAYRNWGISRTYLLAEYKFQSGSDANVSISSQTLFFGLRFEF